MDANHSEPSQPDSKLRASRTSWILFYDGECHFCLKSLSLVARRDKLMQVSFASLQGTLAHKKGFTKHAALNGGTMVLLRESDQKPFLYSDAWIELFRVLGGWWKLLVVVQWIPRFLRDAIYRWVARNRHRVIRKSDQCQLPGAEFLKRLND